MTSKGRLTASISVREMPEVLASMRHEIAQMLIEGAKDEEPRVATRLLEIASLFEVGQTQSGARNR